MIAENECQKADVAINPTLPGIEWFELFKAELLIERGEEEAERSLSAIKNLISE